MTSSLKLKKDVRIPKTIGMKTLFPIILEYLLVVNTDIFLCIISVFLVLVSEGENL